MKLGLAVGCLVGAAAFVGAEVGDARSPVPSTESLATRIVDTDRIEIPAPNVTFVDVRDMAVSGRGVWVLDGMEPFVTFVSADGDVLHRFGTEGQGPSELSNPSSLELRAGDGSGVRVWDLGNARVAEFDPAGSVLATRPLSGSGVGAVRSDIRQVSYVDPFRVRRVGEDYVVARYPDRPSRTGDFLSGTLIRADRTLAELAPILAFSTEAVQISVERVSLEFTAVPLWDGCSGLVVTWLPDRGAVHWVDLDGATRHQVPVPISPREVTLDDIEAYVRRMARLELGPGWEEQVPNTRAVARQMRGQFALEAPVATEIRCGSDGSAWLRMFDTESSPLGLGSDWLRVETTGAVTRVAFPHSFSPMVFVEDEAIGVSTDDAGLQRVARWPAQSVVLAAIAGQ